MLAAVPAAPAATLPHTAALPQSPLGTIDQHRRGSAIKTSSLECRPFSAGQAAGQVCMCGGVRLDCGTGLGSRSGACHEGEWLALAHINYEEAVWVGPRSASAARRSQSPCSLVLFVECEASGRPPRAYLIVFPSLRRPPACRPLPLFVRASWLYRFLCPPTPGLKVSYEQFSPV